jgi:anthranilate/para-aminobenzoate synthase component I
MHDRIEKKVKPLSMDYKIKERFLKSPYPGSLVKRLSWSATTPVGAYERIASGPYSFILESVKGSKATARYSFVGTEPFLILRTKGRRAEIHHQGSHQVLQGSPLTILNNLLQEFSIPKSEGLPTFSGGAVGFFSYDIVRFFEELPQLAFDDLNCPDLLFMFTDTVIAFDHEQKSVQIIYTPPKTHVLQTDRKALLEKGLSKIARIEEQLAGPIQRRLPQFQSTTTAHPDSNFTKEQYIKMVLRGKEYIAAGDIYQANLSQRFSVPFDQDPWLLYKVLREVNPSPFAGFLQMEDLFLVSASPERLIRLQGGLLETRPIAGTRPRGKNPPEDRDMRTELLSSEKERAEHLMLVDLERNDLGKVCRYGSVQVNEFMVTERYSHVMHMVSNIQGELSPGKRCLDVIRAVFPGGTITGVPKVRCMEIIEELEPVVRGPYTGSFGYISFADELDLNLIIRTFVIKNGRAYIQVGAGIVADSEPEREYNETLYKAEALLRTLRLLR